MLVPSLRVINIINNSLFMLLVYVLIGALGLSFLSYGYGKAVESKHQFQQNPHPKEYPDMWMKGLLDCEYSPAKQAYGPARILPVEKVRLQPIGRGCEDCIN